MPKSYSQFKYEDIESLNLDIKLVELYHDILEIEPSNFLKTTLEINSKQALTTEKAKSEFIIAPILFEVARNNKDTISFFSGHYFDVDKDLGLKGFCDFLFSKTPDSPLIKDPVICVVEAKNDNLEKGIPQCIAEMYAARLFNEKHKNVNPAIYGCVTFAYQWLFLKLENQTVYRDIDIYTLNDLPTLLGIFQKMIDE